MTIFYSPQPGGPGPRIYIPQEHAGSAPPGTGFSFRRLLRLAGLRWRYSNVIKALPSGHMRNLAALCTCTSRNYALKRTEVAFLSFHTVARQADSLKSIGTHRTVLFPVSVNVAVSAAKVTNSIT
jgi:hypothetical protein